MARTSGNDMRYSREPYVANESNRAGHGVITAFALLAREHAVSGKMSRGNERWAANALPGGSIMYQALDAQPIR